MAPTPFLYCNSSLLHDLLLTERAFFLKMQVLLLLEIFFFLGENKKCFLLSVCGTKKNFWIMCLFDQSSLFSVVFLKKSSLNREEALNVELRIFS